MSDLIPIKPTIPAADWHTNAADALKRTAESLAAIPDSYPLIAWGAAALGALLVVQRALPLVAPFIPYVGPFLARMPLLQPLIDMAWKVGSRADSIAADKAKDVVAKAAGDLLPVVQTGNARPEVIAALKVLAGG